MLIHKYTVVLYHVQVTIPITNHIKKTFINTQGREIREGRQLRGPTETKCVGNTIWEPFACTLIPKVKIKGEAISKCLLIFALCNIWMKKEKTIIVCPYKSSSKLAAREISEAPWMEEEGFPVLLRRGG